MSWWVYYRRLLYIYYTSQVCTVQHGDEHGKGFFGRPLMMSTLVHQINGRESGPAFQFLPTRQKLSSHLLYNDESPPYSIWANTKQYLILNKYASNLE
jgi:hypothetical protein